MSGVSSSLGMEMSAREIKTLRRLWIDGREEKNGKKALFNHHCYHSQRKMWRKSERKKLISTNRFPPWGRMAKVKASRFLAGTKSIQRNKHSRRADNTFSLDVLLIQFNVNIRMIACLDVSKAPEPTLVEMKNLMARKCVHNCAL